MSNMRIWSRVKDVPSDALKNFNNGRFSGSSIDPTWRFQVLTELFGPCGIGWRFTQLKDWYSPGDTAYYITGCIEYVTEGTLADPDARIYRTSTCTGGTPIQKSGHDEVPKMSETDCISKCCHHLGIAASVYSGKFDGDKYQLPEESSGSAAPPSKTKTASSSNPSVEDVISENDPGGVVIHFGKHKGSTVSDLSQDPKGKGYLNWLLGKWEQDPPKSKQDSILYRSVIQFMEGTPSDGESGDAMVELEGFF